jgi:integrase
MDLDSLDGWVVSVGLDPAGYGTHSMRRTKAALIYRRTKNLRAVQLLLGHNKLESTVRYLGIEVYDALELAEQTEIDQCPLCGPPAPAARPAQVGQQRSFP